MSAPIANDSRMGRYQLIKRLAVGGMADIWLAQEFGPRGYERTAVVKTIRADLTDEEDLIQMLIEEARIARCLRHDNIVELYEVGEDQGTHYLSMEFVFGRDLRQIRDRCLEQGIRIPYEHVATILSGVLSALHYAYHDATFDGRPLHVIHRDVSPQNILVGFDGRVKLLDFGMAKAAAQLSRTRAGVLKGKYAYMSPEQVDFKDLDQRADVFSAGVVFWEMLTQRRLFYRKNEYETVRAVMDCQVPFPRFVRKDLPLSLALICYRALRRSPRWRYKDARQMQRAIQAWDKRSPEEAQDALAEWMAEVFAGELITREETLRRAFADPRRHRQIQDAGFELVERAAPAQTRRPPAPAFGSVGLRSFQQPILFASLSSRRFFPMILSAIVLVGVALGMYFGSLEPADEHYSYLSIDSEPPGVDVSIGGRPVGVTPVRHVAVLPGRHRVVGMRGDARKIVEVEVERGAEERVTLRLGRP